LLNIKFNYLQEQIFLLSFFLLSGTLFWIYYFNEGHILFVSYDWVKENAYLSTLRNALTETTLPWYWNEAFYHSTNKFLSNPEFIATPDILILPWVSNGTFVIIHTLMFYYIGILGMILWMKKLRIGLLPMLFFGLLFSFNGYISAHLSVGHFQWTGYFMLPLFLLLLYEFLLRSEKEKFSVTPSLVMGSILGILFLNGSVHIAVWCIIFMILTILWDWKIYINVLVSIFIGLFLGAGRLIPAVLWFPQKSNFISGYPDFQTFIDSFTVIHEHNYPSIGGIFGTLGWWEYNIYIGFVAFIMIVFTIGWTLKKQMYPKKFKPLLAASLILAVFSLGNVFSLISNLPIPFSNIERVSSRFIAISFVLLLIFSSFGVQKILSSGSFKTKFSFSIALFFIAYELYLHSSRWKIIAIESSFKHIQQPVLSIVDHPDMFYHAVVTISWILSFTTLFMICSKLFVLRRKYTLQV